MGKTTGQLLEWCYYNNFGFIMTISVDHAGNIRPSLKLGWQREGTKVIQLGEVKIFIDAASANKLRGCELSPDEIGDSFCLKNCQKEC